jgi:2-haloacid dehalogenase
MTAGSLVYAFDAYGTLFDVHAAASAHRGEIGASWEKLSQTWRQKHLEYTWVHSMTARVVPFWLLAQRSLDYSIALVGGVPPGVREKLLQSFRTMAAFPEVVEVLGALKSRGAKLAILSNGDPDMLDEAVAAAGLSGTFDAVLSVTDVGIFKPDMTVYELVTRRFGCTPGDVSFQSSNRWDVAGAQVFGFKTVWLNRGGAPDEYPDMPAGQIGKDLRLLVS